jgi:hypothetical protein
MAGASRWATLLLLALAMVDQEADVELDPGQLRRRQAVEAFPERRAGDRPGID